MTEQDRELSLEEKKAEGRAVLERTRRRLAAAHFAAAQRPTRTAEEQIAEYQRVMAERRK